MDWSTDNAAAALAEIACNFVPAGRPAKNREMAALLRFFMAHDLSEERATRLARTGLIGRRPRPTLNSRLSYLRKTLPEAERLAFVRQVTRLMFDIDGGDPRLQAFTRFTGVFLGLRDSDLAQLRDDVAGENSPRVD